MLFIIISVTAGSESGAPKSKSKSAKAETATVTGKTPASSKSSEPSNTSEQLPPNQPAGNVYKAPEYYQHNVDTYADLMVEMASKRLPRPQRPGGN